MRKENKYHNFWRILFILFIVYVSINISVENGYYEKEVAKNTYITKEKMKEFENDIKNNEYVDIKKYLEEDYVDYSSPTSRLAVNISNSTQKIMDKIIKGTTNLMKEWFGNNK